MEITNKILSLAKSNGLLLVSCGLEGNVIRFMGRLTSPLEQVEEGMEIFSNSVNSLSNKLIFFFPFIIL